MRITFTVLFNQIQVYNKLLVNVHVFTIFIYFLSKLFHFRIKNCPKSTEKSEAYFNKASIQAKTTINHFLGEFNWNMIWKDCPSLLSQVFKGEKFPRIRKMNR